MSVTSTIQVAGAPAREAETPLGAELLRLARAGGDAPAVPVAERLLRRAIEAGASDLHLEPEPEVWGVRFRLDGVLHPVARLPRAAVPTLVARLKVLADLPTYVTGAPQEGRIAAARVSGAGARSTPEELGHSGRDLRPGPAGGDLSLSIVPTVHGERAVVRLFADGGAPEGLEALGLEPGAARALERAVLAPQGVVIVSGPAGSGKSTTIHAALRRLLERSRGTRSVVGIEDPVERVVPGITQTQVDRGSGFGFAEALKALLRQDPEVIYLGEARDAHTAGVAIEAGLTGHLLITTLHAGSCAQVFTRLLEMGIEPHLLTSAVSAVFAQRLLRRLCGACAAPDEQAPAALLARLGPLAPAADEPGRATGPLRAVGCPACQGTGYKGRFALMEHLVPDPPFKAAVLRRADEPALAELGFTGRRTLLDHGLEALARGRTSREELERVLGPCD